MTIGGNYTQGAGTVNVATATSTNPTINITGTYLKQAEHLI